jgi:small subunit ribosomal protein S2
MTDILEEIKENIEEGEEAVEEVLEEGTDIVEKGIKKSKEVVENIVKKGKKAVKDVSRESAETVKNIEKKGEKVIEGIVEEGGGVVKKVKKAGKKGEEVVESVAEESVGVVKKIERKGKEAVKGAVEESVGVVEKTAKKGKKLVKAIVEEGAYTVKKIDKEIDKSIQREKIRKKSAEDIIDDFDKKDAEKTVKSLKIEEKPEDKKEIIEEDKESVESIGTSLEKDAEEESLKTEREEPEKSIDERKKELLEKAKKLSEKVDITKTEELKEQVKIKKRTDLLIPLEDYVKAGIYLGTKVVTPDMKPFVYRRRADGLAIFNTDVIDKKLREGIEYLSKFDAKDVILVCKRKAGWKAAKMFSKLTGITIFTKKYPAGVLTNTQLPDFFENELTIVTDSWLDKNALNDTLKVNKEVLIICDTNNFSKGADKVIIGNNKHHKSLGVIFYLLAKGYCKAKGIEADIPDLEEWTSEEE